MSQAFPIVPAGAAPLTLIAGLLLVVILAVVVGVGRSVLASHTATFVVTDRALVLRGDWWGREVPRSGLRVDEARIVDLAEHEGLRPASRRWGTGLPGYAAGWFRLRNGDRALLYLTDRSRAVVVPTGLGYTLLLSPRDPEAFLAALRAGGTSSTSTPLSPAASARR